MPTCTLPKTAGCLTNRMSIPCHVFLGNSLENNNFKVMKKSLLCIAEFQRTLKGEQPENIFLIEIKDFQSADISIPDF